MKFLLDQNLPAKLAGEIVSLGHEAEHVKRIGMAGASDRDIWAEAIRRGAAVVSKDSDFLSIVGEGGGRLVYLRVGNCSNAVLLHIVHAAWPSVVARLEDGETMVEVRG